MSYPLKLLVVDDHKLFIEAVKLVLIKLADKVDIFDAGDGAAALDLIKIHSNFNLVLLDLDMPGAHGTEILKIIAQEYPLLPVIALTASDNLDDMHAVIDAGAMGYIHKSTRGEVMLSAIKLVLSGGIYIPREMVASKPTDGDNISNSVSRQKVTSLSPAEQAIELSLTPRQFEVIGYLLSGKPNKSIANAHNLLQNTVKVHITNKLKAQNVDKHNQINLTLERLGWDIKQLAK